ncbi:hypothetical protein Pcinc_005468 [Petrolisthes cinctipes]|uniref:Uncharacterized protein n=1 Tax=Petrolisthes cinctipes TaxID=88211 RepID=A0AAE1L0J4_PETCI|nr:hypothetical protein Pcinc_005468 [Petrolisthes cinctipes]
MQGSQSADGNNTHGKPVDSSPFLVIMDELTNEELEDTILPVCHTAELGVDVTSDRTSKDLVEDKTDEEGINEENSCVY